MSELKACYKKALVKTASCSAKDAGAIVYVPKMLSTVGFPTKELVSNEYVRTNGRYSIHILSPRNIGVPYGLYPKLVLIYLATEAKIYRDPVVYLGKSRADLLSRLDKQSTGGTGPLRDFKRQCLRLFASSIKIVREDSSLFEVQAVEVATKASALWEPNNNENFLTVELAESFYRDIIESAFPVDKRVLSAFGRNKFAFDLYLWLTARMFRQKKRSFIRWHLLEQQFGNRYSRPSNFKKKFKDALHLVLVFYSEANVRALEDGVLLLPSKPHIPTCGNSGV